ncbi:cysteine-rich PDZ-binding protein, putative [Plasmodium malariae]|uniref:Cysteine-rich PDZ-binding protein n=1 Tax=Plasmodium malariae TaxID=5858 RepID=A0A1C3KDB5_PLAMA|nr:cysteine-rich PDZ-binding protein, putative [Plasmodium malariae]SBT71546.1 cysteine-rich PDZ-binding protein, putative [Plasmodium malariae]SCN12967.1 cysteine-rich PDZ-binding protein, putative [Plasmodium malariae]
MPCEKCEKKLKKLPTPDVKNSSTRPAGVNKLLEYHTTKQKFNPNNRKCKKCSSQLHFDGKYCSVCSYKLGKCNLCGKTITDTSSHNMSIV